MCFCIDRKCFSSAKNVFTMAGNVGAGARNISQGSKMFSGAGETFQKTCRPPFRCIALRTTLSSTRPMVEEIETVPIEGETVFVRDFAAKAYLLFLFHDLGKRLHGQRAGKTVFGPRTDKVGRLMARLVTKNIDP